jgi:hypothetical protein
LLLPGELAKHAVSEGTKAVTKYTSAKWNYCTHGTGPFQGHNRNFKGVGRCLLASDTAFRPCRTQEFQGGHAYDMAWATKAKEDLYLLHMYIYI